MRCAAMDVIKDEARHGKVQESSTIVLFGSRREDTRSAMKIC